MSNAWTVPRAWEHQPAFIVAGGPSLDGLDLEPLRGRNIIAINRSWERVPFAAYCFGMDGDFFTKFKPWAHGFEGECVSTVAVKDAPVKQLHVADKPGLSDDPRKLACSRTSLQGAINLAVLLGASSLVLIAADGKNDAAAAKAHKVRYPHKAHREARYDDWRKRLEAVASALGRLNIPVVNVSRGSAYADLWPTMPALEDALEAVRLRPAAMVG